MGTYKDPCGPTWTRADPPVPVCTLPWLVPQTARLQLAPSSLISASHQAGARQCLLLLVSKIASLGSLCSGLGVWVGGSGGFGLIIVSNLNLS